MGGKGGAGKNIEGKEHAWGDRKERDKEKDDDSRKKKKIEKRKTRKKTGKMQRRARAVRRGGSAAFEPKRPRGASRSATLSRQRITLEARSSS